MGRNRLICSVFVSMLWTGCVYPTERSGEISVDLDPIPDFRQGEIDTLTARVVTSTGVVVPDAQIRFQSSNQNVLVVTPEGELQATGFGISVVTAQAIGFENAGVAEQLVTVKKLIAIDSIRPVAVRYGETVRFYGVGLNPDSLFFINLGDATVPDFFNWSPVDPNKPNGFGVLDVWVAPPTPSSAGAVVVAPNGVVFGDTLQVERRDIYEPNDLVPRALGPLPGIFFNPALAFEQRLREDVGADWYRFHQTSAGDRTIIVKSRQLSNDAFDVILTQQGAVRPNINGNLVIADSAWAFGPGLQVCKGVGFEFSHLPGQIVITAFEGLPGGTSYDIFAPYTAPGGYEMTIANGYFSVRVADTDEENDICDLAKPVLPDEIKRLTIDNPYDPDWFTYTPSTNVLAVFSTTITSLTPGFLDPDLDVFVFQETPDTVVAIAQSTSAGDNATDVVTVTLQAGEKYLILVTDYAGVPARYELTLTTTPAPAAQPDANPGGITKIVDGFNVFPENRVGRR